MALELTKEQADRFRLLKAGKWRDYPYRTTVPLKNASKKVNESE